MIIGYDGEKILDTANLFVSLGLQKAGYEYVNIDVSLLFLLRSSKTHLRDL